MTSTSNEHQLQLVFQVFEQDSQLNINKAIRLYNIPLTTLSDRINRHSVYADIISNLRKLTVLKEKMIVQEVFDLDSRGFLRRIYNIEDRTNRLLAIYDAIHVGPRWISNFVKR